MRKTIGLLIVCMASFTGQAQAGLLGFVVGSMVEHHIEKQQADNGDDTVVTDHPMSGAVAGGVAGAAAEGMAVHEVQAHPFLAIAGGAMAAAAADDAGRDYLEKHGCSSDHPPYWSCPGIPEQHVLPVEAKDLYIEARTEKLRRNMAAAGEPKPCAGCAAHHIVMKDDGKFPASEHARKLLEKCGIDLDSAENGVWLPDTKEDSACHGAYHRTLHTEEYAIYVYTEIRDAFIEKGCGGVRDALQGIKESLQE